ncbi:hypothetical protein [Magnetofaba australis]|uniref:Putative major facilitator superfamily MFS 1 n=1 Tax=Magnetofaba australis IT-1 TaxID=1434232 RepID=A0A1Y2K7B1_9PROT|nr:hypothetical protein [Magnetofaba australis]OSM05207.1 putative major facilitator superfamily MFS 1 [Magnetofaba australis IT-1]
MINLNPWRGREPLALALTAALVVLWPLWAFWRFDLELIYHESELLLGVLVHNGALSVDPAFPVTIYATRIPSLLADLIGVAESATGISVFSWLTLLFAAQIGGTLAAITLLGRRVTGSHVGAAAALLIILSAGPLLTLAAPYGFVLFKSHQIGALGQLPGVLALAALAYNRRLLAYALAGLSAWIYPTYFGLVLLALWGMELLAKPISWRAIGQGSALCVALAIPGLWKLLTVLGASGAVVLAADQALWMELVGNGHYATQYYPWREPMQMAQMVVLALTTLLLMRAATPQQTAPGLDLLKRVTWGVLGMILLAWAAALVGALMHWMTLSAATLPRGGFLLAPLAVIWLVGALAQAMRGGGVGAASGLGLGVALAAAMLLRGDLWMAAPLMAALLWGMAVKPQTRLFAWAGLALFWALVAWRFAQMGPSKQLLLLAVATALLQWRLLLWRPGNPAASGSESGRLLPVAMAGFVAVALLLDVWGVSAFASMQKTRFASAIAFARDAGEWIQRNAPLGAVVLAPPYADTSNDKMMLRASLADSWTFLAMSNFPAAIPAVRQIADSVYGYTDLRAFYRDSKQFNARSDVTLLQRYMAVLDMARIRALRARYPQWTILVTPTPGQPPAHDCLEDACAQLPLTPELPLPILHRSEAFVIYDVSGVDGSEAG